VVACHAALSIAALEELNKMTNQPGVWGIDLGQCALKALRVENIEGDITATAFDYVEHPKILSQPDADPDQLIREALEKFLSRNSLRGDQVAISIPGQSGLARFVKLPPVEEKKINDIVRFEAKQQIPFNLDEVVWDYQRLGAGQVTDGFAMETEIGLFAIKRDTVTRYLQHFKDVNVEVHIVQMAPLALCNFVSYDLLEKMHPADEDSAGKKRCIVALDIGADNSNLVITDGHKIIWQRPIPLGGNHFTRVLTKDMKLTFAKAEHVKRNATKSPDLKQILSSLKPVLNDFVGEVQRSLGYFTNTHRDAHIEYMIGLGNAFRLPGLQKFLSEKLQLEVRKLQKLERLIGEGVVTAPSYTENVLSFGVAYGLALQGLNLARLHTNLLPQDIQVERLVRAKKPWAVTAAAALLLGTAIVGLGYSMQHWAVASTKVKEAMKQAEEIDQTAKGYESKVNAVKEKIEADKRAVKAIVLGQDERMNWIEFNHFINTALPKPDGSNLSTVPLKPGQPSAKQKFWDGRGQTAYKYFSAEQEGTASTTEKLDEEKWRMDLVQANVESVYCVYCQNLEAFFRALQSSIDPQLLNRMRESDLKNPPKDKGWVVELRGYTYHREEFEFVVKAVVDNLARLPIKEVPGAGAEGSPATGSTPPASGTPATPQGTNPPPPPTNPAGPPESNEAGKPKESEHPIWNRVSHVVPYDFKTDDDPDPTRFSIIDKSYLDALIGKGGSAGPGMSRGGEGGGPEMPIGAGVPNPSGGGPGAPGIEVGGGPGFSGGATAGNWQPLGSRSGVSGGGGPGAPELGIGGGGGRGGELGIGGGGGRGGELGIGGGGGRGGDRIGESGGEGPPGFIGGRGPREIEKTKKPKGTTRTEFVILFIWREPTPSDSLLPPEETAPITPPPAGGESGGSGNRGS
jgi:type IV pilus assembly protein PilM